MICDFKNGTSDRREFYIVLADKIGGIWEPKVDRFLDYVVSR